MDFAEAFDLKKRHNGMKCSHIIMEKEYYLGTSTGNYICITCGSRFTTADFLRSEAQCLNDSQFNP